MKFEKLKKLRTNEHFRFSEGVNFSDIEQTKVGFEPSTDVRLLACIEIEVDDAKLLRPLLHQGEQAGRDDMDAGEGEPQ